MPLLNTAPNHAVSSAAMPQSVGGGPHRRGLLEQIRSRLHRLGLLWPFVQPRRASHSNERIVYREVVSRIGDRIAASLRRRWITLLAHEAGDVAGQRGSRCWIAIDHMSPEIAAHGVVRGKIGFQHGLEDVILGATV